MISGKNWISRFRKDIISKLEIFNKRRERMFKKILRITRTKFLKHSSRMKDPIYATSGNNKLKFCDPRLQLTGQMSPAFITYLYIIFIVYHINRHIFTKYTENNLYIVSY